MQNRTASRQEFLADTIIDAIESGIGGWFRVESYRWFSPTLEGGTATPGPGNTANAYATVTEFDPDDNEPVGDPVAVTVDTISSAINRIIRDDSLGLSDATRSIIARSSRANDPESEYDAVITDIVLQIAVLGKHVYA